MTNLSSCGTVSAVGNYFGSCVSPTCTSGAVDTSDWLCSPAGGVPAPDRPGPVAAPGATRLLANVPNPFNPTTRVRYTQAGPGATRIEIYDVAGRLVTARNEGYQGAGLFEWTWTGRDSRGTTVSSGVYYIVMRFDGDIVDTRKAVMLK